MPFYTETFDGPALGSNNGLTGQWSITENSIDSWVLDGVGRAKSTATSFPFNLEKYFEARVVEPNYFGQTHSRDGYYFICKMVPPNPTDLEILPHTGTFNEWRISGYQQMTMIIAGHATVGKIQVDARAGNNITSENRVFFLHPATENGGGPFTYDASKPYYRMQIVNDQLVASRSATGTSGWELIDRTTDGGWSAATTTKVTNYISSTHTYSKDDMVYPGDQPLNPFEFDFDNMSFVLQHDFTVPSDPGFPSTSPPEDSLNYYTPGISGNKGPQGTQWTRPGSRR